MRPIFRTAIFGLAMLAASVAWPQSGIAEDKIFICAVSEVRECAPSSSCKTVEPDDILVAPLIIYDLKKKAIISAAMDDFGREETIVGIERAPGELIVYGHGDDEVWNTIISLEDGDMTGIINSGETAHILFGDCAPHAYPR